MEKLLFWVLKMQLHLVIKKNSFREIDNYYRFQNESGNNVTPNVFGIFALLV